MQNNHAKSLLLYPPMQLASCIAAAVFRDTRNASLSDMDRFNYFPASPLVSVTCVIEGEIRLVQKVGDLDYARKARPMAQQSITSPQDRSIVSWSPAPVAALTIGFYPDAWLRLGYGLADEQVPKALATALSGFNEYEDPTKGWQRFGHSFNAQWQDARASSGISNWVGSDRLADWSRYQLSRLFTANRGRSMRTLERQIKRLSGQTRQSLSFYAAIEDLHRQKVTSPDGSLAELAMEAGFADQSHMGRAVRRATGFSPGKLNQLIETEEAFWCYRLMGDRF